MGMHLSTISIRLLLSVSPLILLVHPPDQDRRVEDGEEDKAQENGMALDEPGWAVVDVRTHDGEALAEDLGDGPRGAALREAAGIHAQPAHQENDAGIEPGRDQAGSEDLDRRRRRHGQQEDVADCYGCERANEEDPLAVVAVR